MRRTCGLLLLVALLASSCSEESDVSPPPSGRITPPIDATRVDDVFGRFETMSPLEGVQYIDALDADAMFYLTVGMVERLAQATEAAYAEEPAAARDVRVMLGAAGVFRTWALKLAAQETPLTATSIQDCLENEELPPAWRGAFRSFWTLVLFDPQQTGAYEFGLTAADLAALDAYLSPGAPPPALKEPE